MRDFTVSFPFALPFFRGYDKIYFMRMRRKNNLDRRLGNCGGLLTAADLTQKDMRAAREKKEYLNFAEVFGNDNPVHLEIGCGKGGFICEMAARHPELNFLACEKISNVLIVAVERAEREGLKNIHFFNCAAQVLGKYLPEGSVSRMYLNFSDPLPKEGYKKQRLTHPNFLRGYEDFLKSGGEIVQKTDNGGLYAFSLESYAQAGYRVMECSEDWDSVANGDVETEYERHFKSQGKTVYRIVARRS